MVIYSVLYALKIGSKKMRNYFIKLEIAPIDVETIFIQCLAVPLQKFTMDYKFNAVNVIK